MQLQILYWTILISCCGYALLRGGVPERWGVLIMAAGSVLSVLVSSNAAQRFQSVEIGILAVDLIALACFLALALRSNRFWTLWATAFLINGVATHAATIFAPQIVPSAYALMQGFWAYPMLVALVMGAHAHHRRRERHAIGSF